MPKSVKKKIGSKKKTALGKVLEGKVTKKKKDPIWLGPTEHGVTQSFLGRYLVCKERFRLYVIEGLTIQDEFSKALEFGNLWHIAEEVYPAGGDWKKAVTTYARDLCQKYRFSQEEILKWYHVVITQFPIYLWYWEKQTDMKRLTPLLQEESFAVPFQLPSGRTVVLRGKFDGVDQVGKGIFLQENKTKGEIDETSVERRLNFDIQTMLYLIALREWQSLRKGSGTDSALPDLPIKGVRYNVVRRPLSGGKGSIRPHKATKTKPAETMEHYYARLGEIIEESPDHFFMRWKVLVSTRDINLFCDQFLFPVLENLADDYEWWSYCKTEGHSPFDYMRRVELFTEHRSRHYRLPYGVYNPIAEGRGTKLDDYLRDGNEQGLRRLTKNEELFPEL